MALLQIMAAITIPLGKWFISWRWCKTRCKL